MIPIPASPMLRFSDRCVGAHDESKSFKLSFSIEVSDNMLAYTLDPP